ncbi:FtsX-like permease family protein [uncultured Desulfobacter sp.]|uniref:ABC transporter permease n=1 Tax=uncultured Desulfobacter sp. TaxID=240139 RepID=UPI0029F5A8A6|nr:FtsX-like permease family protein [uncultured Desulfobacter sp.]
MEILMAWRNIRRNPRRTILTILAIAFACLLLIFMLSLQIGTYEVMIDTSVKTRTGHIQILKQGYNTDHKIRQVVNAPSDIAVTLDPIPHITAVSFRSNAFALLSSTLRTSGGFITGIDPEKEVNISSVPQTIRKGRYLNPTDSNAAVVGSLLAKNLKLDIGDELVVLGSAMDGSIAATVLTVTGIFSSGMDQYDRSAVQIPLSHFQDIFSMGNAVHEIIITCDSLWHVGKVKTAISENLSQPGAQPGLVCMSWDELTPGLIQSIQMDLGGGLIFYAILLVMVAFSIMNTFVMAVFERTKEFGTLMAIGAGPWRLSRVLILESGFLTLCGIILGILAGSLLTLWLAHTGIPMGEAEGMMRQYGIPSLLRPKLTLITTFAGPAAVFLITIVTALYPAFKVHGIKPVEAMRAV